MGCRAIDNNTNERRCTENVTQAAFGVSAGVCTVQQCLTLMEDNKLLKTLNSALESNLSTGRGFN
jgi:hypothetical protein